MAPAPQRGYSALHWNHDRALEAEMELASWLCRAHPGKIIPTGAGPSFRERFREKFPIDVFSTPDLVYVPEFSDENGKVSGYGPPLAFDVVERLNYAWGGGFSTILAQASKTDDLVRFDKKNSFLAYKWKDDVWTFARIEDVASLNLKPKMVDTVIRGEKVRQKNYLVPRELWCGQEEFKALMLGEIKNFEPIDHVELLRKIDGAREDDMEEYVGLMRGAFGEERFREVAKYFRTLKFKIEWDSERDLEPSFYIFQRVLGAALKNAIVRIFKRHEGRWVSIRTLAREISREIGEPFNERRVGEMMREIGFGQFKRDAKGRSHVFISPHVLAVVRIRGVGNERGRKNYAVEGESTP